MELRPLLITRIANMLPGSVLIGLGVEWWFEATADRYLVGGALLTAVGVILAIRGCRLGARYDGETLTVRGMFRSRKIHKSRIRGITVFPAVRWFGRSGRTVWTPIIALQNSTPSSRPSRDATNRRSWNWSAGTESGEADGRVPSSP